MPMVKPGSTATRIARAKPMPTRPREMAELDGDSLSLGPLS